MSKQRLDNLLPSDEELIRALREVSTAVVEMRRSAAWSLVQLLNRFVHAEARKHFRGADAQDAAQEALLGLFKKAESERFVWQTIRSPRSWIRTVVVRGMLDYARSMRRHERRVVHGSALEAFAAPASESELSRRESHEVIDHWRAWGMDPVDGMVLVSSVVPELIEKEDIHAAARASRPPRAGITRGAGSTWELFENWRARPRREQRELHFILRGPSDVTHAGTWSPNEATKARNWAYARALRARQAARRSGGA